MKAKTIEEAKSMAKDKSLETQYKDEAIYIIYCSRTEFFYVDTDSLIRLWERLIGYYENGVYTAEKLHS
ncbi:DNA-binding protein [Sphingobacterium multivorum]|uniref:DNA-binding protein n=1 Tax=Sphingobacterium multivorum TaxID=28454 RepID=UPI003DA6CDE0